MHSDIEDYDHSDGEKKLKTAWVDEDDAQYSYVNLFYYFFLSDHILRSIEKFFVSSDSNFCSHANFYPNFSCQND